MIAIDSVASVYFLSMTRIEFFPLTALAGLFVATITVLAHTVSTQLHI